MAISNVIQPNRLTNMQEMEAHVTGPDGANRLFTYSGMAEVELCGGLPHPRWSLEVVCFDIGRVYDTANGEDVINIVATASLAGTRTDGVASALAAHLAGVPEVVADASVTPCTSSISWT